MKKCPFCAEEIQDEAIKCRHCGEFLDGRRAQNPSLPWYFRTSAIVIVAFCLPPLALPMIWWHPRISRAWKLVWTIFVLALTWLTIVSLAKSWDFFKEYESLFQSVYGF